MFYSVFTFLAISARKRIVSFQRPNKKIIIKKKKQPGDGVLHLYLAANESAGKKKQPSGSGSWDNTAGCVAAGGAVFQRRGPTAPFPPFTHLLSVWFIGKTWKWSVRLLTAAPRWVEEGIPQSLCQLTQQTIGSWSTWCMSFLLVKFITISLKFHFNFHVKWSKKISVKAAAA